MPFSGFAVVFSCFIGSVICQAKISNIFMFPAHVCCFSLLCMTVNEEFLDCWWVNHFGLQEILMSIFHNFSTFYIEWSIDWIIVRIFISCSSKADRWDTRCFRSSGLPQNPVATVRQQISLRGQRPVFADILIAVIQAKSSSSCTVNCLQSDEMCEWSCS